MQTLSNYINGKFVTPEAKEYITSINPATSQAIAQVPLSTKKDLDQAVLAARLAFEKWSGFSAQDRASYLFKMADEIEKDKQILAELETEDTGKPLSLTKQIDIPRSIENFRFFASLITQSESQMHDMGMDGFNYTRQEPLGVVGCISPWNLPLYLLTWKIAPALAMGNCVIAKPSEVTPLTAHYLGEIASRIGFPAGVLNILHGKGKQIGQALCEHKEISAISFTGSTQTGKHIAIAAAPYFKKLSLEMGGKNANIIFADCDFEKTVQGAIRAAFTNQGQVCLCGSRLLIEASIYDRFKQAFIKATRQLKIGDPIEVETQQGALVSQSHYQKVLDYIELAQQEGGTLLAGGNSVQPSQRCQNGYFIEPTVIEGLPNSARVNQEEVFGPFVTMQSFNTEKEAINLANESEYGLSACVWTNQLARAHRMVNQLQVGMVWVNNWLKRDLRVPFGGYKQSGLGREGGLEALRFFTQAKNVYIDYK